jgi:molybdenum cofactor sulfurtransferase
MVLAYPNGAPVVEIYSDESGGYSDASKQGATIAFNVLRPDGKYVPWTEVEKLANKSGVYIRAGGKFSFIHDA